MREIKFRAWDEKTHQIYQINHIENLDNDNQIHCWTSDIEGGYCFIPKEVEQFTGLYDKNGKEIYEGDIIRCLDRVYDNIFIMRVAYSNVTAMFYIYSYHEKPRGMSVCFYDLEVIGNIHDNEELLDEKV